MVGLPIIFKRVMQNGYCDDQTKECVITRRDRFNTGTLKFRDEHALERPLHDVIGGMKRLKMKGGG
jgi:hypothetical protein